MKNSIGFIGLGNMGLPMAQNLLNAGYRLHVYNRTKKALQGAKVANNPCDLLEDSKVIISMVSNDQALESIVNGPQGLASELRKRGGTPLHEHRFSHNG